MNSEFVARLNRTFEHASMAVVARKLKIPHATVRNYYQGRLPAPEVLIKIANETGVSLNWLLTGSGEMYGSQRPPIGLGQLIEEKIDEMIDKKLAAVSAPVQDLGTADEFPAFDVIAAVEEYNDPERIMGLWFIHEGRDYPADYGVVFFKGWASFTTEEKVQALYDAKRVLDRSLKE